MIPSDKSQNNTSGSEKTEASQNIEEGKKAIAASKISDPKPDDQQKKDDQKDAEKWRNEG